MNAPTARSADAAEVGAQVRDNTRDVPQRAEPAGGWTVNYLLVRLSGLLLAVLVLGHFAVTHIATDVAATNANFITKQWSSALWLVWDSVMLAAALAHGGAGAWIAVNDYTRDFARRRLLHAVLVAVCVALLGLGGYVIAHAIYT